MNAGLSNLKTLKAHLLAQTLREETRFDEALLAIGRGVAGTMETYCNRQFLRTVDDSWIVDGDREHVHVPRFPLESVTSVELRTDFTSGWATQSNVIRNLNEENGLIHFAGILGGDGSMLRITYTGGFWWDTSEDDSETQPSGSTALPSALQSAWLFQCENVWSMHDKVGSGIAKVGGSATLATLSLAGMDLVPYVQRMIQPFVRYALS